MIIRYQTVDSPIGPLRMAADATGVRAIEFERPRHPIAMTDEWKPGDSDVLRRTRAQLAEYFAGERRTFDLPLSPRGTDFQLRVWSELRRIPYGSTCSYLQLAQRIGAPRAVRAVGAANGRNPISIVVPCHRVIGADGGLVGYGGGLGAKKYLLELEGLSFPQPLF